MYKGFNTNNNYQDRLKSELIYKTVFWTLIGVFGYLLLIKLLGY
jgi:hypothetical protein